MAESLKKYEKMTSKQKRINQCFTTGRKFKGKRVDTDENLLYRIYNDLKPFGEISLFNMKKERLDHIYKLIENYKLISKKYKNVFGMEIINVCKYPELSIKSLPYSEIYKNNVPDKYLGDYLENGIDTTYGNTELETCMVYGYPEFSYSINPEDLLLKCNHNDWIYNGIVEDDFFVNMSYKSYNCEKCGISKKIYFKRK